jgi:hypothetical protein
MDKFKIGDRIRVIDKNTVFGLYGMTGTVIDINHFFDPYCVEVELEPCDNLFVIANTLRGKPSQMELIEEIDERKKQEDFMDNKVFNVGDRVKHSHFGAGKVIKIIPWYVVEFDKENILLHDGNKSGKRFHCWECDGETLTLCNENEETSQSKEKLIEMFESLAALFKHDRKGDI